MSRKSVFWLQRIGSTAPANWPELESEFVSRETEWDVLEPIRLKIEALHKEENQ
jgi:hypothetical protein